MPPYIGRVKVDLIFLALTTAFRGVFSFVKGPRGRLYLGQQQNVKSDYSLYWTKVAYSHRIQWYGGNSMQVDRVAFQVPYVAPEHVRDAIVSLARTEDVKFSPAGRRLAVAGFFKHKITIFGISIIGSEELTKKITLTDVTEISSKYLNYPHGVDFIDEGRIIVANREGDPCIFELPSATGNYELTPLAVLRAKDVATPGSVAIIRKGHGVYDVLICNNYVHSVTKHQLDLGVACSTNSNVLIKKWLDIPDGICVSRKKQWIAVSNHNTHSVFTYKNNSSLNEFSDPDGILRGVYYPHGLRFTSDGRFILVADAGAPYVNIYQKDDLDWHGVRYPLLSFRVLNDEDFMRGRHNPEEGGPKGIDVDNATNVIVTTTKSQPLAFFDLDAILENAAAKNSMLSANYSLSKDWRRKQKVLEVSYELELQNSEKRSKAENAEVQAMMISRSWRITAPLRWLMAKVRTLRTHTSLLFARSSAKRPAARSLVDLAVAYRPCDASAELIERNRQTFSIQL